MHRLYPIGSCRHCLFELAKTNPRFPNVGHSLAGLVAVLEALEEKDLSGTEKYVFVCFHEFLLSVFMKCSSIAPTQILVLIPSICTSTCANAPILHPIPSSPQTVRTGSHMSGLVSGRCVKESGMISFSGLGVHF